MKELKVITNSVDETHDLGKRIAEFSKANMVFLFNGDLGAGKTTLTQGIAKGLGVKRIVTSPTFNILKIYNDGRMPLYHIDAYRLEGCHQDLGFDEFLDDDGITVIEWSEFVPSLVPDHYMIVNIRLMQDDSREFIFTAFGAQYEKLLEDIK